MSLFPGNSTQPGTQYYNLQDIRQTYEALGIAYPMGPAPYPANGGPNNNVGGGGNGGPNNNASGGGGMRLHAGEATQPPPPPPGVMPGLMGAAGGPMPYCFAGRGQPSAAVQPPGGHNQPLLGTDHCHCCFSFFSFLTRVEGNAPGEMIRFFF